MTCKQLCKCSHSCSESIAQVYCTDNPLMCARRHVALAVGCEHVPADLRPEQFERVLDCITQAMMREEMVLIPA